MTTQWNQFHNDVDQILEATGKGDVNRKLQDMTTIIVSLGAELFGEKEGKKGGKGPHTNNKREVKIHNIRQEMKTLKRNYKQVREEECIGLAQLMCILRKKIRVLCRVEWHRRRRPKRARKWATFISDPFRFTEDLLGRKCSGKLDCPHEDIDRYLMQTYSDPTREQEFGSCRILINPTEPSLQFNMA